MNEAAYDRMMNVRQNADNIRETALKNIDSIIDEAVKAAGGEEGSSLYTRLVKIFNQSVEHMEIAGMAHQIEGEKITLKEEIVNETANAFANRMINDIETTLQKRVKEEIEKRTRN